MIELQSVSHRYPDGSCALRRLDLSVERGTLLGITGSNGSGKSTLLRHLNGLLRPTAGRVLINGSDAAGRTVAALSRTVGLAFQEPADQLFQSTVLAEVTAGSASPERARSTLELVGLSARGQEHPQDLGYSRRKLLTMAAVIAMGTPVVVLDEPTTGQDAAGLALVGALVRFLREEGRTVIVAGHDRVFMHSQLDRTIRLIRGAIEP